MFVKLRRLVDGLAWELKKVVASSDMLGVGASSL